MKFGLIKFKDDLKEDAVYVWNAKQRRWVPGGVGIPLLYRILDRGDVKIVADIRRSRRISYTTFAASEDAVRELNLWDYVFEWVEANNVFELPSITNTTLEQVLEDVEYFESKERKKRGRRAP
jgi:hypothetical protein